MIVSVGRLVPKKGFDLLLRSLAELGDGRGTMGVGRCVIIGDGPERASLEELRAELGLEELVCFAGAKDNSAVRRMIGKADLFVLPCRVDQQGDRDGIPVVLMEAMAAGLPVISGDLPAIRELVDHQRNGLLVDPEHDGELRNAIDALIADSEKRAMFGRSARRRVDEEFSLDANLDRLEHAFDAALGTVLATRAETSVSRGDAASSRAAVAARRVRQRAVS